MDNRQPLDVDTIDSAVIALDRIEAIAGLLSIEEVAARFGDLSIAEQSAIFGTLEAIAATAREALAPRCIGE